MSDEEYQRRIVDLQRYLPFLENTIKRLKSEEGKLRETQISKLQSLFDFLKNTKGKKLKLDVLRKCEEVILKLYEKKPSSEIMYKYMCRNPPEDKYIVGNRLNLGLKSDDVFSVDQQKLSTNSSENSLLTKPAVIPSQKVQNDRLLSFTDHNEFIDPSLSNNKNSSVDQSLNYPVNNFTSHFSENSNWKIRTNEINPSQEPKNCIFNIYSNKESKLTQDTFEVDFSLKLEDAKPVPPPTFEVDFSLKLESPKPALPPKIDDFSIKLEDPTPVPPPKIVDLSLKLEDPKQVHTPKIKVKENLIDIAYLEKRKKTQILKSSTCCKLNKPPLSKSDLQELVSSTMSDNSVPLINENLDKPAELKAKICTKLEDQHKVSKPLPVVTLKPKQTSKVVERVIKEQDNLFGMLLSTIDEQIMSKKDQKKKEVKTTKGVKKDNQSDINNKYIEIKHKKDDTIVNEQDIYKEKKNLKTNRDLKYRSIHSNHNTKHKEYDKDSQNKEHETKSKDETNIKDNDLQNKDFDSKSKDKEITSRSKESVAKAKELKHKKNESKNKDDKKNEARKSEDIKFTRNPKNKVEKSTTIKKVDKSRRYSAKEEKQKTDKTFDKTTVLPTQPSKIDDKKYDFFRPNQDHCRPNKIQLIHKKNEIQIDPDQLYSNEDHFTPDQDHFSHNDNFRSNPGQFRRYSDEFRENLKFVNQDVPFRSKSVGPQSLPQELNPIDFYENEYKNKRDDLSCQKSFKDRGSHYSNKYPITSHENKRESPKEERRHSLDRFSNKDKYRDRRRYRLDDRFSREDQRFPINIKNYVRRSRFEEKQTPQNKNDGSHRKRRSKEKKDEKLNIEPKEEMFSSLDTVVAKPVVVKEYSTQNIRIPIICKSEIEEEKIDEFGERKSEENEVEVQESKMGKEETKQEVVKEKEVKANPSTSKEIAEIPKTETEEKINMFNIFMKTIFGSGDSSFLLEYLDKCGKPVPQSKTKRVRRIIDSDSESEKEIVREMENEHVEKMKIEDTSLPKETEQQTSDKLQEKLVVNEMIDKRRKQTIYSSDLSPEKSLVTNEESPVKEKIITKRSVKKIGKKRSPLELLLADYRTISKGSFAETDDQNQEKDFIIREHETVNKQEEKREEINEITPEKNKFPRRRLRSISRCFVEKINSTIKSSNEENSTDEKEKKEGRISVMNEIKLQKNKIPQRRSRSLSRRYAEKMDFSTVKSSYKEKCADEKEKKEDISVINKITSKKGKFSQRRSRSTTRRFSEKVIISTDKPSDGVNSTDDKEKEKKKETISVINEITPEKSNFQRRRLRSLSRSFPEIINISTDKPSDGENFTDDKEKEKKKETISVINEITPEKSNFQRRRLRSLSRSCSEKINISTDKPSDGENSTDHKEKEKKKETISVINEITPEKSNFQRRRLRSLSRSFSEKINISTEKFLNEENSTDDKGNEKKEETLSVESKISAEVKPEKKKRGRILRKCFSESSVSSTIESETTKKETIKLETVKWLNSLKKRKQAKMRTNWANGIIKQNRKRNKVDRSKQTLSLSTENSHLSITGNFNENIEIETELPQILQSQILEDEEYALFKIDSKQDIYYFLDGGNSFDCKLCDYKGKSIVSHYRTRHPESENLISRLNPEEAEKAQIESKMNKFVEIEPFAEIVNGKSRKTTFVCRFCNMLMTTEISTFVDHVCCHTGEYRYLCELCPFIAGYKITLCNHYYKNHPEIKTPFKLTPIWPSPPNFRIMFGYLCKACNFTQILRKNIQKHINVSHLGQNIEIIKISMSSESVTLDDIITTKNIEIKIDEIEKNKEKIPESIKEKGPDDISSREHLIEDKKIENMHSGEISNVKEELVPQKDFSGKICSTISFAESESNNEDTSLKKSFEDETMELSNEAEMNRNDICSTISLAESESNNEDTSPKKNFEDETMELSNEAEKMNRNDKEMDISNVEHSISTYSNQKGVLDKIQELAANLSENNDCHSKLAHFEQIEIKDEEEKLENTEKYINVGAMEVEIRNKKYNYICKVPHCNFTNLDKLNFMQHCNDVHSEITVLCEICAKENPYNYFTMISLFSHLFDVHSTNNINPNIVNSIQAQTSEIDPSKAIENVDLNPELSQPDMGFLQIKDIRTLTEEEEHNLQFNFQNTSSKLIQNSQLIQPNLVNVEKNLTDLPANNALKCVSSANKKQLTVENVRSYKTKKIFNEMLVYPKILDIYKCPIEICSFSSGSQNEFKIHIASHKCQITVCVYCQKGIKFENLSMHIDAIHSHCTLQCAFCFYRTVTKKYLVYHLKNIHKQSSNTLAEGLFYHLNPKNTTKFVFDIPPRNVIIFPYKCSQDNCAQQFLIADDFMVHLHIYHKKNFTCAICDDPTVYYETAQYLIQHYVMHNIARYQCRYCICGTPDIDTMFMHYAKNHQHLEPICYVRQKKNENVSSKTLDDIILINMDSKQFLKPKLNTKRSTTKQNSISSPTITSTIPEDHNYSTRFVEESPTTTVAIGKKNLENSKKITTDQEKDVENSENIYIDLDNYFENSETIEVSDLNKANSNFNGPHVILKHKGIELKNTIENAVHPLSIHNIEKSNELTNKVTHLKENELYKCGSPNCTYSTNFLNDFRMHLFTCNVLSNIFFCGHCDTKFTSVIELCKHIEIHGKNNFTCGICGYKSSLEQVVKHMKELHKIITTKFNPVSLKKNMDKDHFIVEAINETETKSILKSMLFESPISKEKNKVENNLCPEIIDRGLNLSLNLVSDLKKNEKMPDEMTTFVTSSHHEQMEGKIIEETNKENKNDKIYPEFVPVSKRFICGALNCNYLTHSDQMLRHHLTALHADETEYKCPHCQIVIHLKMFGLEIDKILCHLKMHDSHLYKCLNCEFFHYKKHKIEKHICENHPDRDKNIAIIRELDTSDNSNDDKPTFPLSLLEQITTNDDIKDQQDKQIDDYKINEEQNITVFSSSEITPLRFNNENEETSDSDSEISNEDMSNSPSNFHCKYCDFEAKTTKSLQKHERSHYMNYTYNCNCCNYAQFISQYMTKQMSTLQILLSESQLSLKRKRPSIEKHIEENPANILLKNKGTVTTSTTTEMIDDDNIQIYYRCFLCSRRSNELDEIRSHFFESHKWKKADPFKYKKIIRDKSKIQHYKCNYCEWFADAKSLKKHCLKIHDKTWVTLRKTKLKCTICSLILVHLKSMKNHFNREHSTENLSFHTLLEDGVVFDKIEYLEEKQSPDQQKQEMKKFKCPNCRHFSNNYNAMKMHLVKHFNMKQFVCSYCNVHFTYPYILKHHHIRKHGDLPLIINKVPEFNEQMKKISATILHLNEDRTYSTKMKYLCSHCKCSFSYPQSFKLHQIRKHGDLPVPEFTKQINEDGIYSVKNKLKRPHSRTELDEPPSKILVLDGKLDINPVKTNVAMNSTSNQPESVEFSFYGSKPCNITDYKNVMSEIDIMGKVKRINVVALSQILNLSPKLQLVDIKTQISY